MGERDLATLAKARRELEELYMGVPDESVNLTFGYLADVKQHVVVSSKQSTISPNIQETNNNNSKILASSSSRHNSLNKLPSLDFNRAIHHNQQQQHHTYVHGDTTVVVDSSSSRDHHHHRHNHNIIEEEALHLHGGSSRGGHRSNYVNNNNGENSYESRSHVVVASPKRHTAGFKHGVDQHSMGMAYDDDVSGISMTSNMTQYPERGGRRRPGIPHSNICTVCSTYIYIFRHRCLVCGRVYCSNCVSVGMGEKTEGRKCVECLGRRFSQRYIQRAGKLGCCWSWRYPSMVKQQELKWAEKGPRRSGERGYNKYENRSVMMSSSRSPVMSTPTRPGAHHVHVPSSSSSFVINSPFSAYSPTRSPIPF